MDNMELYNSVRAVPDGAKKTIQAGRLKGMTDINPMWRIQALTERFGPCGIGWSYSVVNKELIAGADGEIAAIVDIELRIRQGEEWSAPIPGTGGAMFVANERNGPHTSDECYKMALTDAISVSCKALGMGADVYWASGSTKYSAAPSGEDGAKKRPEAAPAEVMACWDCGAEIVDNVKRDGEPWAAADIAQYSTLRFGRVLCPACQRKAFTAEKAAERAAANEKPG